MATAECVTCGLRQRWPGKKGRRLADYSCRTCGGPLRGYRDPNKPPVARGKKYTRCAYCGRPRLYVLRPPGPWRLRFHGPDAPVFDGPCCETHEPIPAWAPSGWPDVTILGRDRDPRLTMAENLTVMAWRDACWGRPGRWTGWEQPHCRPLAVSAWSPPGAQTLAEILESLPMAEGTP